jgi:hypothetical protein
MQIFALESEYLDSPKVDPMGYKEDLQRLHSKIDAVANNIANAPKAAVGVWQKASPIIAFCALAFALFSFWSNHSAADLKNQVTLEVSNQLKDPLKKLDDVSFDVKEIKNTLAFYGLKTFASLPKSEVKSGLPQLKKYIEIANTQRLSVPQEILTDVRQKLSDADPRTPEFWVTVAAVINYQSLLDQLNGNAPDPTKVSKACEGMTEGSGGHNYFSGIRIGGCIVDLDTNDTFSNVVISDSVIRYSGGP